MSHSSNSSSRKLKYTDPIPFTPHFAWEKSGVRSESGEEVVCESVPLESVARKFGTPAYVYSRAAIRDAYEEFQSGLGVLPNILCFAVKSNCFFLKQDPPPKLLPFSHTAPCAE